MANLVTYRLRPRAAFHFGEQGRELEGSQITLPSDSLFSALVTTLAEERGTAALETFLAPFVAGQPPFRLTSLYPAIGRLPLLPLPQMRINAAPHDAPPRKFNKKVRFVSPTIFSAVSAGAPLGRQMNGEGAHFLQQGAIWLDASDLAALPPDWYTIPAREARLLRGVDKELRRQGMLDAQAVWYQGTVPRVTVDRQRNATAVYKMGCVTFAQEAALWFGIAFEDEAWRTTVETLLHSLADRGLGGERSNGYGAFALDGSVDLPMQTTNGPADQRQILLSRYHPGADEVDVLQDERTAYDLVAVGGWLRTPQHVSLRRKTATLLTEGSVLARPVSGRLVDVTPVWKGFPHPVYRYGYALSVPAALPA